MCTIEDRRTRTGLSQTAGAFRTESFDGVVDGFGLVSFRQFYDWNLHIVNAESAVAALAVEVNVAVLDTADGGLAAAYLVFGRAASVLE